MRRDLCPYCGTTTPPRVCEDEQGTVQWCVGCHRVWETPRATAATSGAHGKGAAILATLRRGR